MKICNKCKEYKEPNAFSLNPKGKMGLSPLCKSCAVKKAIEWNKKNPKKRSLARKKYELKRLYGITPEQKSQMLLNQNCKCLICDKILRLVVDHSHDTGKIRGLLCNRCNAGLGCFSDNPALMEKAAEYVIKNS